MKNEWSSFKTSKPEFNLLSEGEHMLRIIRYEQLNSFQQYNGSAKENLPAYANACPQLAITVVAAEEGKSGGLTFRLNRVGFVKMSELPDKEQKKYEDIDGWACKKDEDGDLVRIVDPEKVKSCENIANQFAAALQVPEGSDFIEALDSAIEEKTVFRGTVSIEDWDGSDQHRLGRFRAVSKVAVEADFEE